MPILLCHSLPSYRLLICRSSSRHQEEAKDCFKELLAAVGCRSDWSWEQAMRHIVNDPR